LQADLQHLPLAPREGSIGAAVDRIHLAGRLSVIEGTQVIMSIVVIPSLTARLVTNPLAAPLLRALSSTSLSHINLNLNLDSWAASSQLRHRRRNDGSLTRIRKRRRASLTLAMRHPLLQILALSLGKVMLRTAGDPHDAILRTSSMQPWSGWAQLQQPLQRLKLAAQSMEASTVLKWLLFDSGATTVIVGLDVHRVPLMPMKTVGSPFLTMIHPILEA
jgi:hypothetical protein